jgi:hypothetical protein
MNDGFVVPILTLRYGMTLVGVAGTRKSLSTRERAELQLAAIYAHARIRELSPGKRRVPALPALSPRERECLAWTAAGKSDREIGDITLHQRTHRLRTHGERQAQIWRREPATSDRLRAAFRRDIRLKEEQARWRASHLPYRCREQMEALDTSDAVRNRFCPLPKQFGFLLGALRPFLGASGTSRGHGDVPSWAEGWPEHYFEQGYMARDPV